MLHVTHNREERKLSCSSSSLQKTCQAKEAIASSRGRIFRHDQFWQRTGKGLRRFVPTLPDSKNGRKTLFLHPQASLSEEGPKCRHLNLWGSDGCWAVWVAWVVTLTVAAISTGSIWILKCCLTLKNKTKHNLCAVHPVAVERCSRCVWYLYQKLFLCWICHGRIKSPLQGTDCSRHCSTYRFVCPTGECYFSAILFSLENLP